MKQQNPQLRVTACSLASFGLSGGTHSNAEVPWCSAKMSFPFKTSNIEAMPRLRFRLVFKPQLRVDFFFFSKLQFHRLDNEVLWHYFLNLGRFGTLSCRIKWIKVLERDKLRLEQSIYLPNLPVNSTLLNLPRCSPAQTPINIRFYLEHYPTGTVSRPPYLLPIICSIN